MAIHPLYANAILDGRKRVEFRKRPLADDVRTVLVYATAPVKKIVGEFTVDHIVVTSPHDLWASFGAIGAIDQPAFDAYYAGARVAVGIQVREAQRYPNPVSLGALAPEPTVPQSFMYLPASALRAARSAAALEQRALLARLADGLAVAARSVIPKKPLAAVVSLPRRQMGDEAQDGKALAHR